MHSLQNGGDFTGQVRRSSYPLALQGGYGTKVTKRRLALFLRPPGRKYIGPLFQLVAN